MPRSSAGAGDTSTGTQVSTTIVPLTTTPVTLWFLVRLLRFWEPGLVDIIKVILHSQYPNLKCIWVGQTKFCYSCYKHVLLSEWSGKHAQSDRFQGPMSGARACLKCTIEDNINQQRLRNAQACARQKNLPVPTCAWQISKALLDFPRHINGRKNRKTLSPDSNTSKTRQVVVCSCCHTSLLQTTDNFSVTQIRRRWRRVCRFCLAVRAFWDNDTIF